LVVVGKNTTSSPYAPSPSPILGDEKWCCAGCETEVIRIK
jgi:hypothetical protein